MKRPASSLPRQPFDHGMAAAGDVHFAGVAKLRARIAVLGRHLGERGGDIQLRDRGRRGANALRLLRRLLPDFGEDALLDFEDLLFGGQNLALVFLQLRRGEALRVDQGLLAFVIGGGEVEIGLRDLDVVAEDIVEADFERADAGAVAFAGFDLRDVAGGRSGSGRAVRRARRHSRREWSTPSIDIDGRRVGKRGREWRRMLPGRDRAARKHP